MSERQARIDIDEIMSRIRAEVQSRHGRPEARSAAPALARSSEAIDWSSTLFALDEANERAEIGEGLPDLSHVGRLKRFAGLLVTRLIVKVSVLLRTRQSHYNRSVVKVLRQLVDVSRELEHQVAGLNARADLLQQHQARGDEAHGSLQREVERLRLGLGQLDYRFGRAMSARRGGGDRSAAGTLAAPGDPLDGLYVQLMHDLRGTTDLVRDRLRVHLDRISEAGAGSPGAPILDVACGRGEWLELLQERGWHARGLDSNPVLVARCKALGLDVDEGDAIEALRLQEDESLGAVTAFHLVEHLPFAAMVALIDESVRALRPGGVLILETPDPDNLLVGSASFWLDPTHHHPVPRALLELVLEARGLTVLEVVGLHPLEEWERPDATSPPVLDRYLYGPQDYAIVARKP